KLSKGWGLVWTSARWIRCASGDSNRHEMAIGTRLQNGSPSKPRTGYSDVKRAAIVLAALAAVTISCPCAIGQENAPQGSGSIRQQQLRYPRVRTASQEKDGVLRKMLE